MEAGWSVLHKIQPMVDTWRENSTVYRLLLGGRFGILMVPSMWRGIPSDIGCNEETQKKEKYMKEHFSSNIKRLRFESGMSQEELANRLGISTQAVSKWECALSYPDIELLPVIADVFGVTIDSLLGHEVRAYEEPIFPKDSVLRLAWVQDGRVLSAEEYDSLEPMPLICHGAASKRPMEIVIYGNIAVDGELSGNLQVGGSVVCDCVNGNIQAGLNVNCDNVNGNVEAGGDVSGDRICGNANAGMNIGCDILEGSAYAGMNVACDVIQGDAYAGNDVTCDSIGGNVTMGKQ